MIAVSNDFEESDEREPIDLLAEEFADRWRRGERPDVEDYAAKHPDLAESIRKLFPAIAFLEGGKLARALSGRSSSSRPRTLPDSPPVERLGENRIVREIGRGGMGVVYEAEQEPLGRRVAVKVLLGHASADPKGRERFIREAHALAKLRHPNIVAIHSVGEQDGRPYYVMPLIDGTSLDRVIADDRGSDSTDHVRWVASIGAQAAEALAYAHKQGVLHRDVKPANLLIDDSGTVCLADFGLARLADDLSLTATGEMPGTLRYLAPECLDGDGDERADVYGLGLTLYELLAGRPAFAGTNRARLIREIAEKTPEPLRSLVPTIPRDLETIVLKAIARGASARYATAQDMADDLRRFLRGEPIQARRASPIDRTAEAVRRSPATAALAVATAILAVIAAYFVGLYLMAPPRPEDGPPLRRPLPPPHRPEFGPPPPFPPQGPGPPRS